MRLARVTERAYGRYRMVTHECEVCKVAYTEAGSNGGEPEKPGSEV
jgi:hypothetical protein